MELDKEDLALIEKTLKDIDFMRYLSPAETGLLIKGFEKADFKKGDLLIKQGTPALVFYILASGSVGVYRKRALIDRQVAVLGPGSFFGEMALLENQPRTASVTGESDGTVFTLLRNTFQEVIMRNPMLSDIIRKTAKKRQDATHEMELKERLGNLSGK